MGNAARNRRLRAAQQQKSASAAEERLQQQGDTGPLHVSSPATRELMAKILGETEMPCRATFLDTLFKAGTLAPVTDVTDDGQPVFDLSERNDRVPVVV